MDSELSERREAMLVNESVTPPRDGDTTRGIHRRRASEGLREVIGDRVVQVGTLGIDAKEMATVSDVMGADPCQDAEHQIEGQLRKVTPDFVE